MHYPNGPYGQGFPQQPYGFPPPPPAAPSGATGIIAGVLAGLGGFANIVGGLLMAFGLSAMIGESSYGTEAWTPIIAITICNIVAGVVLSVGTVTLLLRTMLGRWLVVAGCAVSMISSMISLGMSAAVAEYQISGRGADAVGLVFPIATLVLVLLPSTTAWIRAKRQAVPPPPQPPYYPPYPGYPA